MVSDLWKIQALHTSESILTSWCFKPGDAARDKRSDNLSGTQAFEWNEKKLTLFAWCCTPADWVTSQCRCALLHHGSRNWKSHLLVLVTATVVLLRNRTTLFEASFFVLVSGFCSLYWNSSVKSGRAETQTSNGRILPPTTLLKSRKPWWFEPDDKIEIQMCYTARIVGK